MTIKRLFALVSAITLTVGISVGVANGDENAPIQKQSIKQDVKQDPKQNVKQDPKQNVKQNQKQNVKQDQKQDVKQDPKQNVKQDPKQNVKQDPKQDVKQDQKQDVKQDQKQDEIVVQRSKTRKYGPNWKVGDKWSVNVTTNNIQGVEQKKSKPTKWDFKVEKVVPIRGVKCFQVKVATATEPNDHPIVYFWVDSELGAMKRVTVYDWDGEEWKEHTEFYNVADDKPVAVVSNVSTVPIDMPIFPVEGVKDLADGEIGSGSYDSTSVSSTLPGVKDAEESVPFSFDVKETVRDMTTEGAKSIADFEESEYAKALTDAAADETIEVELSLGELGTCKQIWTPNAPWPAYSQNGDRESVLVETHLQD